MIRNLSCYTCVHRTQTKGSKPGYPTHCYCEVTKRWGKLDRGTYCLKFVYRQLPNSIAPDGIPIKNKQPLDYRTAKQWLDMGRQIKEQAKGVEMHANSHSSKTFLYYLIEDTEQC